MSASSHVQLFDVARTAHFERVLRSGRRTTILYAQRRYDFDTSLAARVGARRAGCLGAFWYTLRHDIDVLEVAEPLVVRAAPRTCAAVLGARLRGLLGHGRPLVVTYAIENKDPRDGVRTLPLRSRLKWRAQRLFVRPAWRAIDRIAFGTSQAEELYRRLLGATRAQARLVPALPVADLEGTSAERGPTVTFLGEFSERKGFPQLLAAWPAVAAELPDARLVLIGKGAGAEHARAFAAENHRVKVEIDPPREVLFSLLGETKVLALPSQPRPRWREQVGLPIVEALGKGCLIVTTEETGLAEWLTAHGHHALPDPSDAAALARAIVEALRSTRTPAEIVADLPAEDGRAEAERWILTGETAA